MTKEDPRAKPTEDRSTEERREFLRKAVKVGITTPTVVTLLLSAGTKRGHAAAP